MNKICRNAKNYKLTEGQEYEILQEENGYVRIINDSGKNVRYDASLFEDVFIPPPPPARTEQDCINSITYINNVLRYVDINNEEKNITVSLYLRATNEFSCGINRIEGINSLCGRIENQDFVNTDDDDFIELKKALFTTVFNYHTTRETSRGMWMCSTNRDNNYEDYQTLLDTLSTHNSGWFRNPNSGNQIKLWYGIINQ
jgi:hypothetical protein